MDTERFDKVIQIMTDAGWIELLQEDLQDPAQAFEHFMRNTILTWEALDRP
jgi:hypothetical protein